MDFTTDSFIEKAMVDQARVKVFGSNGVKLVIQITGWDGESIYYYDPKSNESMVINYANVLTIVKEGE